MEKLTLFEKLVEMLGKMEGVGKVVWESALYQMQLRFWITLAIAVVIGLLALGFALAARKEEDDIYEPYHVLMWATLVAFAVAIIIFLAIGVVSYLNPEIGAWRLLLPSL